VIILIGFFTDLKLPGNIPVGLAALLVGTAIGWIGGYMSAPDVVAAARDVALSLPSFDLARLAEGLSNVAPLLATAIPLGIYNFTEGMANVESAAAAGDNYNLRAILGADGAGAIVGSAMGCPFPPAVYIGHPGWKAAGGRTSYSLASGVFIALMCFFGMFSLLGALLPLPAIVPILLYIGLLIGAQAFQEVPKAHAVAVVFAIIPNIASWAGGLMTNSVTAAGSTVETVGEDGFAGAGLVYHGTVLLGGGAILAGMVLGAIVAFIIDKRFFAAAVYCFIGAALGFIGLIHAEQVGWNVGGQIALGYAFAGLILLAFGLLARRTPAPSDTGAATPEPTPEAAADGATVAADDTSRPATA
jgi:AGZA family xanthine/uracil permease-like MFS transporter